MEVFSIENSDDSEFISTSR